MLGRLKKRLEHAEGRSEFIIAVVCDIRGFSSFSTCHESPDTAMFIKRFYLKLLEDYFDGARFAKPTGDGLLLIFRYSEDNLKEVSAKLLNACIRVMDEFPKMFDDDAIINFETPKNVGFGISRGPACCLFSGRTIIDYSGRLLNLAARLNDLARPKGIVLDGNYVVDIIPEGLRTRFKKADVYVRGIAEENPMAIHYLSPEVCLPEYSLYPISKDVWESTSYKLTVAHIRKLRGSFSISLPAEPASPAKIKLETAIPNKKLPGFRISKDYETFNYVLDAEGPHISFPLSQAHEIVNNKKYALTGRDEITFLTQFVRKHKKDKKKRKA